MKALSVATAALLLALSTVGAACAATHDANVEWDGLFHDQGPVFANTNEPDTNTPLSLKFRAYKGDLTGASVKYFDTADRKFHSLPMKKETAKDSSIFEYWQSTIPASSSRKYYRFCVQDGSATTWYNARGASQSEPSDGDFYIVPGFKTPHWLKNGIVYQIYPDRFYNGDPTLSLIHI